MALAAHSTVYARRPCLSVVGRGRCCRPIALSAVDTAAATAQVAVAPFAQPIAGKVCAVDAVHIDELHAAAGQRLVVVDVYTAWCGPCKMIAPELEKMAEEWGDKVVMSKIDCTTIPENKKWAMGQSVKALPTFLLFKEGKRVNDMTGAKAANLKKLIEAHM